MVGTGRMCRRADVGEKRTAQQKQPRLKETAAKTATAEASLSWHAAQGKRDTNHLVASSVALTWANASGQTAVPKTKASSSQTVSIGGWGALQLNTTRSNSL